MQKNEVCIALCRKIHKESEIKMFKNIIDEEYRIQWELDNLPVAVRNEELGYVTRGITLLSLHTCVYNMYY